MDTSDSTAATANPSKEQPATATVSVKSEGEDKMEVEGKMEEKGGGGGGNKKVTLPAPAAAAVNTASGGGGEKKKSDEPDFQMIANPARVLPQQVR